MISILALVVSVGAAISQFLQWRHNGPVVKVKLGTAMVIYPEGPRSCLRVTVQNVGRYPAYVQRWNIGSVTSQFTYAPSSYFGVWNDGPDLPLLLEPGGPPKVWNVDYHQFKAYVLSRHPNEAHRVYAMVVVNGKTVRSNEFVDFGDLEICKKELRPTLRQRIHRMTESHVGGVFLLDTEVDVCHLYLQVGGIMGARNVRLDLVPSDGSNNDALRVAKEVFPPISYQYLRYKKELNVNADWRADLPGLPVGQEWQLRVRWTDFRKKPGESRFILNRDVLRA